MSGRPRVGGARPASGINARIGSSPLSDHAPASICVRQRQTGEGTLVTDARGNTESGAAAPYAITRRMPRVVHADGEAATGAGREPAVERRCRARSLDRAPPQAGRHRPRVVPEVADRERLGIEGSAADPSCSGRWGHAEAGPVVQRQTAARASAVPTAASLASRTVCARTGKRRQHQDVALVGGKSSPSSSTAENVRPSNIVVAISKCSARSHVNSSCPCWDSAPGLMTRVPEGETGRPRRRAA